LKGAEPKPFPQAFQYCTDGLVHELVQFPLDEDIDQGVFVGANDYPRDYLQAWLALAGSRLPLYIVPGNHDGYRFEDPLGRTRSDGLLLFEDTFGPSYAAFDRPPFRFILANSYDLPKAFRTSRRSEQSNVLEKISDKLNTLNWAEASVPRNCVGFERSWGWMGLRQIR